MINWKAELSNGEFVLEEVIEGEKSPWLRLLDYLAEKDLKIVNLSLSNGEMSYNLPNLKNAPQFKAFFEVDQPLGYKFFRMVGSNLDNSKDDLFAVIEADYGDKKLQLWVDESSNNCWCIIK